MPQPWHHLSMRPLTIILCLLATPALADVAGVASVILDNNQCKALLVAMKASLGQADPDSPRLH